MRAYGAFPVYSGRSNAKTIRMIEEYIAQGMAVGIFPEGTRSKTIQMIPANPGVALIAMRTGAPILPVGITGTENMRGMKWLYKRPLITIRFGMPFHLLTVNEKLDRETVTRYIMERIAELLPPEYRGVYANQETANNDQH